MTYSFICHMSSKKSSKKDNQKVIVYKIPASMGHRSSKKYSTHSRLVLSKPIERTLISNRSTAPPIYVCTI